MRIAHCLGLWKQLCFCKQCPGCVAISPPGGLIRLENIAFDATTMCSLSAAMCHNRMLSVHPPNLRIKDRDSSIFTRAISPSPAVDASGKVIDKVLQAKYRGVMATIVQVIYI